MSHLNSSSVMSANWFTAILQVSPESLEFQVQYCVLSTVSNIDHFRHLNTFTTVMIIDFSQVCSEDFISLQLLTLSRIMPVKVSFKFFKLSRRAPNKTY